MKNKPLLLLIFLISFGLSAQKANIISFSHDGKTVNGTFTVPAGNGPFRTIIINPGSGASDRDGTLPLTDGNSACLFPSIYGDTLRPYKELSDAMVTAGYAVLRYDKLEYTYPTTLGAITFHKLWLPVESAINYIKTRSDVDTNAIILIGHSEGSALIPFIAKGRKDIKALISIAGARTPFDSLYAWQLGNLVQLLRPCGATKTDSINAKNQGDQILSYFDMIRKKTYNGSTPAAFGVPPAAWYDYFKVIDSVTVNYNADKLPTLFLGMGIDIQVPPKELIRFSKEIKVTKDFWSVPGLIHNMNPDNDPHVSKIMTDTILFWLRHNNLSSVHSALAPKPRLQISPNPFSSIISLSFEKPVSGSLQIKVHDMLGQIVYTTQTDFSNGMQSIDLSSLSSGMYFIEAALDGVKTIEKILKY